MKSKHICVALASITLAGCTAPVIQQRCVVIPIGYVYSYDRPYSKYEYDRDDAVCPAPQIPLTGTNSVVPPGPGPNPPPPNPPAPIAQGSVAGDGVAAAFEGEGDGEELSIAGGGGASAYDGPVRIDVSALRLRQ